LLPLAIGWWLRARIHGGVDYVSQFWWVDPYTPELGTIGVSGLVERVFENTMHYGGTHLPLLLAGRANTVVVAIAVVIAAAALVGWGIRLRSPGVAELLFPLYLGLILVWPAVWSGERFLLPAYPLILGYAAEAMAHLARRIRPALTLPVGATAAALVLLLASPALSVGIQNGMSCTMLYRAGDPYPCLHPIWRDFFGVAEWAGESLPEDAVIISRKPRLFYGLSARRGLIYPLSSDPADFFRAVRESGANYLVFDQLGGLSARYLGPILMSRPDAFCILKTTSAGHTALFGILPDAERGLGAPATGVDQAPQFEACPSSYLRLRPVE
jgi:hypothetical protein